MDLEPNNALAKVPDGDPPETYTDLARDYPIALIAGGLVLGALAGAMLPRGIGRKLGKGVLTGALMAGELGRSYSAQASQKLGDVGSDGREKVIELGARAQSGGRKAASASREFGIRAARETIKMVAKLRG
ncbi:MAG: hypothetical protein ACKOUT_09970 [Novosphingobium sp.]